MVIYNVKLQTYIIFSTSGTYYIDPTGQPRHVA